MNYGTISFSTNYYTSLKKIKVSKGTVLQKKGEYNTKVYKVLSGLLRSYCTDEKGREHIFMFAPEGWLIADACPPEEACDLHIDALEDATVVVTVKDLSTNFSDKQKLTKRIWVMQRRILTLMSLSAMERYTYFITTYPNIAQRVPQKMIASYLGITPEALSKTKRKYLGTNQ